MQKYLLALCSVVMLIPSCRKQKDPQASPPPPAREYDVIITASLYNPANNHYEAACWFNGTRNILDAGTAVQAFPYGIEKKGTDVYVSGGFAETSGSLLMPCYWKNGQKIDLPVDGLTIDERCAAGDLKWFNNALYLLGDADLMPVIWKIKNGQVAIIPIPWGDDVQAVRKAGNLELYNNKLYFGGNQKKTVNGQTVFTAGYWTVDQNDAVSFYTLEDHLPYALGFNLSVTAKGTYLAGEYSRPDAAVTRPVVWTTAGHLPVSEIFNPSYHRLHTCVTDIAGNIYLNVLDIQSYQPVLWKVRSNGAHELIKPAVPAGAKGFCEAVDVSGEALAYVYKYELSDQYSAAYMINGKKVELDIYNNAGSDLKRLKLFERL